MDAEQKRVNDLQRKLFDAQGDCAACGAGRNKPCNGPFICDTMRAQRRQDYLDNPGRYTAPVKKATSARVYDTPGPLAQKEQAVFMDEVAKAFDNTRMIKPRRTTTAVKVRDMVDAPPHYTQYAIEPLAFILANKLDFPTGNVIKYICRWHAQDGIQDLKKARSYLDKMIAKAEKEAAK